jgi:hypothetical protein
VLRNPADIELKLAAAIEREEASDECCYCLWVFLLIQRVPMPIYTSKTSRSVGEVITL